MNDVLVKGWCPTLMRPMETGDGLLVRLHIKYGIVSAAQARAIAHCAERFGNGHIDLTSRGNLQFRGVTQENCGPLLTEITKAGFGDEPRPEKVAHPDHVPPLGFLPSHDNVGTVSLGLVFGRLEVATLLWLADAAEQYGNGVIYLSAWRTVFLPGVTRNNAEKLITEAKETGFIMDKQDARRALHTCPGAPACSSALGETRQLALKVAGRMPHLAVSGKTVHVSGCAKGCASSQKNSVVITARKEGYDIAFDEVAGATPVHSALNAEAVLNLVGTL